jgi:hypothetical protein
LARVSKAPDEVRTQNLAALAKKLESMRTEKKPEEAEKKSDARKPPK